MGGGPGPKVSPLFHLRINEIRIGLREKKRVHDAVFSSIFWNRARWRIAAR